MNGGPAKGDRAKRSPVLRLAIKLHGKEAKGRNVFSGIGNLDIVPDAEKQKQI